MSEQKNSGQPMPHTHEPATKRKERLPFRISQYISTSSIPWLDPECNARENCLLSFGKYKT